MGTIVLLMEDNLPVQSWRLGQIVALHPGRDNVIRVADVKTTSGVFRRSIRKLAPLPITDNDEPTISAFGMEFQPAGVCSDPSEKTGNHSTLSEQQRAEDDVIIETFSDSSELFAQRSVC